MVCLTSCTLDYGTLDSTYQRVQFIVQQGAGVYKHFLLFDTDEDGGFLPAQGVRQLLRTYLRRAQTDQHRAQLLSGQAPTTHCGQPLAQADGYRS
jgi:hypothetical protein